MVPNVGDYYALAWRDNAQALVRNASGVELLSNICRHRQAIMLQGAAAAPNIVCPLHRWTYDLKGELLGAPHFADKPCLKLERTPLTSWHGLLFDGPRDVAADLAGIERGPGLRFLGLHARPGRNPRGRYNWKSFIEVYLEDYHVGPFHPGLGQFVTTDESALAVRRPLLGADRRHQQRAGQAGTKTYERWHKAVLDYYRGELPKHGAIWVTIYPNIMLEWYAHVLIVSTLIPRGVDRTTNIVEFYYPEEIALFEREFVEAEQAAYLETAAEDDEIAERMDAGRRALYKLGRNEVGPYQSPMEDGMQHFHEFLRRELEPGSLGSKLQCPIALPCGTGVVAGRFRPAAMSRP